MARWSGRPAAGAPEPFDVDIKPGDRVAIIGRSGTGKTTLARSLIDEYPRALALDPKRRLYLPGWQALEGIAAIGAGWPSGWPRVIGRPALMEDDRTWLDACCRRAYQVAACAVLVDELAGLATASDPPEWLNRLLTRGRDTERGPITTFVCTQRPRRIPLTVISEAEHVFVFELNLRSDRAYVAEVIGDIWKPQFEHSALYWRPELDRPVELLPIPT